MATTDEVANEFIAFAIESGVLRFGEFTLKSGRVSPYFFNSALFDSGARLARLARFYAAAIVASRIEFDMLYGPAYKGIPLVATVSVALAEHHARDLPWCFNRKEAKDHGEGGITVGAPIAGRVLIIDDVISAGTSVRESVQLIRAAGAEPSGVLIALDRMERGGDAVNVSGHSATEDVARLYGIPVVAIASLADLLAFLESGGAEAEALAQYRPQVQAYRERYGV